MDGLGPSGPDTCGDSRGQTTLGQSTAKKGANGRQTEGTAKLARALSARAEDGRPQGSPPAGPTGRRRLDLVRKSGTRLHTTVVKHSIEIEQASMRIPIAPGRTVE